MKEKKERTRRFRILPTGDPKSAFRKGLSPKEVLEKHGFPRYLLSSSSKVKKSADIGVHGKVLYLTSGILCPASSPGCLNSCLGHTSGFMREQRAATARDRRSAFLIEHPDRFIQLLEHEIAEHRYEAQTMGMLPCIRLNGCSDANWEVIAPHLFSRWPDVQYMDYTKIRPRMMQFLSGKIGDKPWPKNYHLTYSLSEKNHSNAEAVLKAGGNVAMVFWPNLPSTWKGIPVIDADKHDARFLDEPSPCIVGLSAKGVAREELTGFVVHTDNFQPSVIAKSYAA